MLNLSFNLTTSLIEKMKNNFMIIEAYCKKNSFESRSGSDKLLGTIKLPLHEFYLKFRDQSLMKHFLSDQVNFTQPLIGVNGWVSSHDPFTGKKSGEINAMLAIGSNEQVINLQKLLFDQSKFKNKHNPAQFNSENDGMVLNEHRIVINLESLKLKPLKELNENISLDESDYFVRYKFLTNDSENILECNNSGSTSFIEELKFRLFNIATKNNSDFESRIVHKFLADKKFKIKDLITR